MEGPAVFVSMTARTTVASSFALAFAAALLVGAAAAQPRSSAVTSPNSLYTLNATEADAARAAAQADTRIVSMLGTGASLAQVSGVQLSKADTAPYLSGQTANAPARYVTVILFNPRTSVAANARVQLGTNRVVRVEPVALNEVPVFREEADQAAALVRADRNVRAAVGATIDSYRLRQPGTDGLQYALEVMPIYTSSVRDLCYTGRCVELHFRTARGYLPLRAQVNLAARTVTLVRRDPRQEHGGMHQ